MSDEHPSSEEAQGDYAEFEGDTDPVNLPKPYLSKKVAAGGEAGALTIILVFLAQSQLGWEIPAEVSSAVTTLISFVAGFMKKES